MSLTSIRTTLKLGTIILVQCDQNWRNFATLTKQNKTGKIVNLLWQKFYSIGRISIVVNDQIMIQPSGHTVLV